ncbi:MAG TPA: tRNA glutamyl-Q(34) synthetase GluQRS [Stellaceae bacterium]|nr:tRNA glutamyl-Q(34) synthetase GluQRS [Stellaceae bacterium]
MPSEIVTRFAPSPTGLLHLGTAHAALFAWKKAREAGGRFLLRIEDIDQGRAREEFVSAISEDLAWLGLDWDGPVRRQSQHLRDYRAALARLDEAGLLYPCFCSRAEIQAEIARAGLAPHGTDGPIYPGTCRALPPAERVARMAAGESHALRLDAARATTLVGRLEWEDAEAGRIVTDPVIHGDVVLAGKDQPAAYHLAVTVDDAIQGVTLVTRGKDLFDATHVHRLLQALLGLPTPRYWHHPLLTDASGRRLAKRDRDLTLRALREAGATPVEARARAGFP